MKNEINLKLDQLNFSKLKKALNNIENESSYYCGGTLFLDFIDMPCVGINLDGRGFVFHPYSETLKRSTFLATKEMTEIVRRIYLKHKGRTKYYESKVKV